ncbi:MAG: DsbA family protein [Caulobacterales bacterium]
MPFFALGLAASAVGAATAAPTALPDDMTMGNPKARIEVVEYASLSCPHCAHFDETIFPTLKAKYIDTGKVRYTLKEMLTEPMNVAAAGFLTARCAGPAKYFTVVDQIFRSQPRWTSGNIKPIFQEIAAANGVDEARFDACILDQAGFQAINARAQRATQQDGVDATPTLFINGKRIATPQTPAELEAAIAAAAAAKGGR